jgi:hypothetical protein
VVVLGDAGVSAEFVCCTSAGITGCMPTANETLKTSALTSRLGLAFFGFAHSSIDLPLFGINVMRRKNQIAILAMFIDDLSSTSNTQSRNGSRFGPFPEADQEQGRRPRAHSIIRPRFGKKPRFALPYETY